MFYQDWDKFYYPGLENWYHVPAPQYQAQQAPQYHYRFVIKMSCEHSKKIVYICRYSPKILRHLAKRPRYYNEKLKLLLDSRKQR